MTVHRLLGPTIYNHPGTTILDFNSIAPTFMHKGLEVRASLSKIDRKALCIKVGAMLLKSNIVVPGWFLAASANDHVRGSSGSNHPPIVIIVSETLLGSASSISVQNRPQSLVHKSGCNAIEIQYRCPGVVVDRGPQ
jgi:hypothetical protein